MLIITVISYGFFRNSIITTYEKDTKILFYTIQNQTSSLLSKLLHQYTLQKNVLLNKHALVAKYIQEQQITPTEIDLKNIYQTINKNEKNNNYNIYITGENLVIKNTTFKKDIGFDISFAKSSFDEHFEKNTTGICTPLFEKSSKQFLSYTDAYLSTPTNLKANVLQVSYSYLESKNRLIEIQKLISKYPNIVDAKAYIIVDTGFVNDIILKDFPSYKPNLKEILSRIEEGSKVNEKLSNTNLTINTFDKDNIYYTEVYISTKSAILDNTKIVYSILLDDTQLHAQLKNLNLLMFFVVLLGIFAIFATYKIRRKEIKFTEQDKFVQSSMHEIKTPLSIITLNNELRELEFGKDEYSQEIDSALKTLKTSYDDMSFTLTKDELTYPVDVLTLSEILTSRVSYFKTIATSNSKSISLHIDSACKVKISTIELIRLIDNNLSNAIKYSFNNSTIEVTLKDDLLTFHNHGKEILNQKNVFNKYFRENTVIGGHGLGLSIVKEITQKYSVNIVLNSSTKEGTTFSYKFKCHTDDISP